QLAERAADGSRGAHYAGRAGTAHGATRPVARASLGQTETLPAIQRIVSDLHLGRRIAPPARLTGPARRSRMAERPRALRRARAPWTPEMPRRWGRTPGLAVRTWVKWTPCARRPVATKPGT